MRVARTVSLDETRIEEVPDPLPGPGEVVCRVVACGVCGSDVTGWYVERKLPAVLGHEPVGIVEAVGEGVRTVAPGQRVAIHHHAPCGRCSRCRRGHETLCARFRATGIDPGGFAERVRVPAELVGDLLDVEDLDPIAATFVEPLACVVRALDRARMHPADDVLVVGAGGNGLLAVAAAREAGAAAVRVAEPRADRRALAASLGAAEHAGEPVDVAIVCTAAPEAIAAAADALGPGGALCLYGIPTPGQTLDLDAWGLFERELNITASYSATVSDMRAARDLIAAGRIDPMPLVTHRLPLAQTGRALALVRERQALKAVVEP